MICHSGREDNKDFCLCGKEIPPDRIFVVLSEQE